MTITLNDALIALRAAEENCRLMDATRSECRSAVIAHCPAKVGERYDYVETIRRWGAKRTIESETRRLAMKVTRIRVEEAVSGALVWCVYGDAIRRDGSDGYAKRMTTIPIPIPIPE